MGKRILLIARDFLPVLMDATEHHYRVKKDPLPCDCKIIGCEIRFAEIHGADHLVLLLESPEWEEVPNGPALVISPLFERVYPDNDT